MISNWQNTWTASAIWRMAGSDDRGRKTGSSDSCGGKAASHERAARLSADLGSRRLPPANAGGLASDDMGLDARGAGRFLYHAVFCPHPSFPARRRVSAGSLRGLDGGLWLGGVAGGTAACRRLACRLGRAGPACAWRGGFLASTFRARGALRLAGGTGIDAGSARSFTAVVELLYAWLARARHQPLPAAARRGTPGIHCAPETTAWTHESARHGL